MVIQLSGSPTGALTEATVPCPNCKVPSAVVLGEICVRVGSVKKVDRVPRFQNRYRMSKRSERIILFSRGRIVAIFGYVIDLTQRWSKLHQPNQALGFLKLIIS